MNDFDETSIATFTRLQDGRAGPADLVVHYLPRLRAFVQARIGRALRARESESDIVQSVCRDLCRSGDSLEFGSEPEFRAWLFKAALHKVQEKARYWGREKRSAERERAGDEILDEITVGYSQVFTPSRIVGAREEIQRFEDALERLPDNYREVIALTRIAGLSHAHAARELGTTEVASRKLLGRALRKLAEELGEPPDA